MITFDQGAVGKCIKDARLARGLSRVQVGMEFGISEQAVGNWERGRNCPEISCLAALCDLLRISVDFLLTGMDSTTLLVAAT